MTDFETMAAAWQSFEGDVLKPHGLSALQTTNMRIAFYAGAHAFFSMQITGMDPDKEVTRADTTRLEALVSELGRFNDELLATLS
jgi:hypothetical protein